MKWWLGLFAACGSSSTTTIPTTCGSGTVATGETCVPIPGPSCGTGTRDSNGACTADTRLEVRATPTIRADGWSATEVRVVGTQGADTAGHDAVVLSLDRASAGTLVSPSFVLDDLGGATNFMPCGSLTAGCTGPARISVALAAAPLVPLAHVDVTLVAPLEIGSTAPCLTGGNVLVMDGHQLYYDDVETFSTGFTFDVFGADDRATAHVAAANGPSWALQFSTHELGIHLIPSMYERAVDPANVKPGEPAFGIVGTGTVGANCNVVTSFEIQEFTHVTLPDAIASLTATFALTCDSDPTRRLTGCLHYAQ